MSHTALPHPSLSSSSLTHHQQSLHPALRAAAPSSSRARTHRRFACAASNNPSHAPPTSCSSEVSNSSSSSASRRALLVAAPSIAWAVKELQVPAQAAASERVPLEVIKKDYDRYAAEYDELDGGSAAGALGFDDLRGQLLRQAQGNVLEVAVGTGLNLKHYSFGPSGVKALTGVDISRGMLDQASARVSRSPLLQDAQISLVQADASALPLPSASFDCVVSTFSLCVIPDPLAALKEMARVVRPGGKVLLLEHARSDNPLLGAYQDATASAVAATAKGCVWNQDVPALLTQAGLKPARLQRYTAGTIVMVEAQVDSQM